ncbi:MAG: polysaccharide deacetylase family protein [Bacteroidetes bacterium]|nr:MAG: polysaccharide deacetylase family protein [Bacteroidota bacterium]
MFKHSIPALFPLVAPSLTWKVNTADKALYITFDDGPHPKITPKVLDILDEYQIKATFFCVGENVKKYPDTFKDVISRGHAIGNHTYNHLSGYTTPNDTYYQNIEEAAKHIDSKLFRPPYGRITPRQIAHLKQQYKIVMWSILTRDYEEHLNLERAKANLIKEIKPGDVIVFHDSEKAEKNMFALLPPILEHFKKLHYSFLPL